MADKNEKVTYKIDLETADNLLQNVFAACDTTPNTVPLKKIEKRNRQNLFTDNLLIIIAIVIFVISFFVPLCFPHSPIFVSVDSRARELTVVNHEMTADSFSIAFDGLALDYESSYMQAIDGTIVKASSYDRFENRITFPYTQGEYNIYVFDTSGRGIHLLLSPHDK